MRRLLERGALAAGLLLALAAAACSVRDDIFTPSGPTVAFVTDQSLTDESITTTTISVRLSEPAPEVVTVRYASAGGTASPGADVNNTEGEVTFAPLETTAMIELTIVDDGVEEAEEDIRIELRSAVNAAIGEPAEHRLLISANLLPRVRFVSAASSAAEGAGAQSFAVELDTLAAVDTLVRYTWSGTAEPADHGVVDGYLTIRAGGLSQPIPAPISNDPTDEDDETIDLSLIAQAGVVVAPGRGQHVHTILDDDPPPAIAFAVATSAVGEGAGTAMISVSLSLASEKTVTVNYAAAAGGTASAADFTLAAGTLTFPPGATTLSIPVTIVNDTNDEANETVVVALSNAVNATPQGGTHTLTITDDD